MSDVGVSKPGISINVSGGSAVLGNVSQGDNNRLDTKQTNRPWLLVQRRRPSEVLRCSVAFRMLAPTC